jgi:uncharacterized protein YkuJ
MRLKQKKTRLGRGVTVKGEVLAQIYTAQIKKLDEMLADEAEADIRELVSSEPDSDSVQRDRVYRLKEMMELRLLRGFQLRNVSNKKLYWFDEIDFTSLFYVANAVVPGLPVILGVVTTDYATQPSQDKEDALA